MHIYINNKYLTFDNYKVKCSVGKRGIGLKKKEGDLITPKGTFKIRYVLYRKDRVKSLQTKLKKFIIRKNMGWCDDSRSKKYNKPIQFPFKYRSERLFKKENVYDIILVLNYNMKPIRKNKGSAIFIHVSKKNYKKTEGCIAIKKIHLLKIIKKTSMTTKVIIGSQI
jgi:L,D-peptidoglycan transpeptidase YkuD (ErfK/YbiS/YcfS/YnhG family)